MTAHLSQALLRATSMDPAAGRLLRPSLDLQAAEDLLNFGWLGEEFDRA